MKLFKTELQESNLLNRGYDLITMKGISSTRRDICKRYISIHKEMFDVQLNEEVTYKEILDSNVPVIGLEKYLVAELSKLAEEKELKIPVSTIFTSAKDQAVTHIINKVTMFRDDMVTDTIKHIISMDIPDKPSSKEIESVILEDSKEFMEILNGGYDNETISFISIETELPKMETKLSELLAIVSSKISSLCGTDIIIDPKAVTDSAAFVPKKNVIIDKCNDKIDEVVAYYTSDRILTMIGGDIESVDEVSSIVNNVITEMHKVVGVATDKDTEESLLGRLNVLQINMINTINRYNKNISTINGNMNNGMKVISVDETGEPVEVIEEIIIEETKPFVDPLLEAIPQAVASNPPVDTTANIDNSKYLNKYPELVTINTILSDLSISVQFREVGGNKDISPIIEAEIFAKDRNLERPFYIDLNGTVYNKEKKIMIRPNTGIIENGRMFSLDNLELLCKYARGEATSKDLALFDIITDEMRRLSDIIDLTSINPSMRETLVTIILQNQHLLDEAVKNDVNARFKLGKCIAPDDFELVCNNSVKKSLLLGSIKRKKQTIKCFKGVVTLCFDDKQK